MDTLPILHRDHRTLTYEQKNILLVLEYAVSNKLYSSILDIVDSVGRNKIFYGVIVKLFNRLEKKGEIDQALWLLFKEALVRKMALSVTWESKGPYENLLANVLWADTEQAKQTIIRALMRDEE